MDAKYDSVMCHNYIDSLKIQKKKTDIYYYYSDCINIFDLFQKTLRFYFTRTVETIIRMIYLRYAIK